MPANITINEAPKEPKEDSSSFKGFSKAESDSITTVGLGFGALVGGYLLLNYLDSQGYITQVLEKIGIGSSTTPTTTTTPTSTPCLSMAMCVQGFEWDATQCKCVPTGTATATATQTDYAKAYSAQQEKQRQVLRTDFAKYSPDLTDISGDVEYKLHGDDSNLGAIEDPDDQYYYENADFSPGRSQAYPATLEHDPRTDIAHSYLGQEDGVLVQGYETVTDDGDIMSYPATEEDLVPSDLSRYRVERDNLGNLLDVSLDR